METKEIDLTKYINLHFKAVVDGGIVSGQIFPEATCHIRLDFGYKRVYLIDDDLSRLIDGKSIELNCSLISDFEIEPRDPETYRDWQVGDRVHYPNGDNDIVIFRSGELVVLADDFTEENRDVTAVNTCSQLFDRREGRLVLTDIEQQIIEEKKPKPYEFKKGEPVLVRDNDENIWILSSFIQFIPTSCFHVTNGVRPSHWKQCIPYNERTMHVLGTAEDYKEE